MPQITLQHPPVYTRALSRQQKIDLAEARFHGYLVKAINKYPQPFSCVRSGHSFVSQEMEDIWQGIKRGSHCQTAEETFEALAVIMLWAADCLVLREEAQSWKTDPGRDCLDGRGHRKLSRNDQAGRSGYCHWPHLAHGHHQ